MKNFLFILTLCFINVSVWAKTSSHTSHEVALRYYSMANKAELAIVRKDIPTALSLYKQAFAVNFKKAFSRDLYNAFHCAMDCRQYSDARIYLTKLLSRGLQQSFINKSILGHYINKDLDSVKAVLAAVPNDTLWNSPLNNALDSLLAVDQEVRQYFSRLNDGNYMTDSVKHVDQRNAQYMWKLLRKNGVPNVDVIGNDPRSPLYGPFYDVVILHHTGGYLDGMPYNTFDTLLYNAIFTFDYAPVAFMRILQSSLQGYSENCFIHNNVRLCYPLSIQLLRNMDDNDKIYTSDLEPEREAIIDRYRQSIGLESISDLKVKVLFDYSSQTRRSSMAKYQLGNSVERIIDYDNEGLKQWLKDNPNAQTPE